MHLISFPPHNLRDCWRKAFLRASHTKTLRNILPINPQGQKRKISTHRALYRWRNTHSIFIIMVFILWPSWLYAGNPLSVDDSFISYEEINKTIDIFPKDAPPALTLPITILPSFPSSALPMFPPTSPNAPNTSLLNTKTVSPEPSVSPVLVPQPFPTTPPFFEDNLLQKKTSLFPDIPFISSLDTDVNLPPLTTNVSQLNVTPHAAHTSNMPPILTSPITGTPLSVPEGTFPTISTLTTFFPHKNLINNNTTSTEVKKQNIDKAADSKTGTSTKKGYNAHKRQSITDILPWKGSLLFRSEQLQVLYNALLASESTNFTKTSSNVFAATPEDKKKQETKKSPQHIEIQQAFYLNSIMYLSPTDWVIWINNRKLSYNGVKSQKERIPSLDIVNVAPHEIKLFWRNSFLDDISPDWQQKFVESEKDGFVSATHAIIVNKEGNGVSFTLKPNQTFIAQNMEIVEGNTKNVSIAINGLKTNLPQ